jgi:hypothetical protein
MLKARRRGAGLSHGLAASELDRSETVREQT